MFANIPLPQSDELQGTVLALRTLQSEIAQTLEHLEANLVVQEKIRKTPIASGSYDVGYTLFGQTFRAANGSVIFIEVLRHFAELDKTFPMRYSKEVEKIGRKRRYVARTRKDVYPGKPKLLPATAQFAPGWFVGTNEDNGMKLKLLRRACDVLDLRWNQDLKVRMP